MKSFLFYAFLLVAIVAPAYAQDQVASSPATATVDAAVPAPSANVVASVPPPEPQAVVMTPIEKEINEQLAYLRPSVNIETMPSLFFSIWEHDLVRDARRGLNTRDASDDGVDISAPRDISLGGIVYAGKADWTIWLNNVRISPTRIPTEVMDLKVFRDYIELEWFDATTNQIFPIRLRPHQRFNLDTRIFLPG